MRKEPWVDIDGGHHPLQQRIHPERDRYKFDSYKAWLKNRVGAPQDLPNQKGQQTESQPSSKPVERLVFGDPESIRRKAS